MSEPSPKTYDIVIVGAGPVGLLLSTCLARWGYKIKHIDNRAQPTPTGRADGIQPRSLDLLKNMGLKRAIMAHKPAKVYEVAFWDPVEAKGIGRSGTWPSCPKFIDARYPFTTLLHQGLIERVFLKDLAANGVQVDRPWTITDFATDEAGDAVYPVRVDLATADGQALKETVRAKYLFSGEGGRSFIRQKLGIEMAYKEKISHVWGVMDGVVRTNFPDIKMKCTIHSDAGSIMVIPREANMVRLYIQLASSDQPDFNPRKTATAAEVQEHAKAILKPYEIEWESVDWYSVYPIGQGIAARYSLDERVLMGGDACHTHSPKAGQGMNTAFLDAQNLAWKIHHVESGIAPRSILKSYESERRKIAQDLLAFDNNYAKLFSTRQPAAAEVQDAERGKEASENQFIKTFKESCEFTSGYGVAYPPNLFNWSPAHAAQSPLFLSYDAGSTTQRSGRVITPSTVTRVSDANVVHLEQEAPFNGSWRLYIFAGRPAPHSVNKELDDFAHYALDSPSFLSRHLHRADTVVDHHASDNKHSPFFTFLTVFAAQRTEVEIDVHVPRMLREYRDRVYADNVEDLRVLGAHAAGHAKIFGGKWLGRASSSAAAAEGPATGSDGKKDDRLATGTNGTTNGHAAGAGLSEASDSSDSSETKGIVVVRPDGYVGCVVRLVEGRGTVDALDAYFGQFSVAMQGERHGEESNGVNGH